MNPTDRKKLLSALNEAIAEGKPWVAFNNQPDKELHATGLHFFEGVAEAERFCEDANGPDVFWEQVFNFDHYIYLSVATLKADINDYFLTTKNLNTMTQESYEFTSSMVKNLGFDEIGEPLLTKMEQNLTEFTLEHTRKFGNDEMKSVLYFSKGDEKDYTFFNKFEATLKQEGKEDLTQTFFIGPKYNYTLQERYNMMDGRAAYREQPVLRPVEDENGQEKLKPTGDTYLAWRQLNFKESDGYGNFNSKIMFWNHEKELVKYPIKDVDENYAKQRLLRQLEKGNKVNVTLIKDGQEVQAKMIANPRMTRLDFYDSNGQSLIVRKVEKQAVDQSQKADMTPQEVQRAAMARAAEKKEAEGQKQGAQQESKTDQEQTQTSQQEQKQTQQQQVAAEEKQAQGQRRRQGVRV